MFTRAQEEELVNLLCTLNTETKIYIGTDSVRFKKEGKWFAKFATVCIVHKNGNKGCSMFVSRTIEPDYDLKKNRPSTRLMNEVMKSCEAYVQLAPLIDGFKTELHCDVNLNPMHGSNCVATQAAGYVLGVTGLSEDQVKFKPNSLGASFGADHAAHYSNIGA
jgi:predicted RNase H-related nuclease YkuK (DUF458 family)